MTAIKPINLVKYAGEFWITLADYTLTRKTEGYSGSASVKAAVRTFVVKQDPGKYIAFRGEQQIKGIIAENRENPLFNAEDFTGHTRTALIHVSMLNALGKHFSMADDIAEEWERFILAANKFVEESKEKKVIATEPTVSSILEGRSSMQMQLRNEITKIQQRMEMAKRNLEKLQHALSALESLELEDI